MTCEMGGFARFLIFFFLGEKHGTFFLKQFIYYFYKKHTLQLVQSGGREWLVVCGKLPPPGCSYTCTFDTGVSSTKKFYM